MNRERRKQIRDAIKKLDSCADDLTFVKDDEDYSRENTPENLQGGEAYRISEEASEKLEDAISDIREVVTNLEDI